MKPTPFRTALLLALPLTFGSALPARAADTSGLKSPLPAWGMEAASRTKGKIVRTFTFSDREGEHLLILSRHETDSTLEGAEKGRLEKKEIRATLYRRNGSSAQQAWLIQDGVDCPMLDSEAVFFTSQVTMTDLMRDGVTEVTVPYRLRCAGDVSPATIKVILRKAEQKFALRGESMIVMTGQPPFGGSKTYDPVLQQPQYQPLKAHLTQIWNQIYQQRY